MNATAGEPRSMLEIRKELVVPGVAVLHLSGRVSVGKPCQDIEEQIDQLIREQTPKVILDLTEVQRVDSTGFGTFVMCSGRLKKAGGELRIAAASGMVNEIAHSSQISRIVKFHETVADAISGLSGT
jgi:anti-sigma B factor antagonist